MASATNIDGFRLVGNTVSIAKVLASKLAYLLRVHWRGLPTKGSNRGTNSDRVLRRFCRDISPLWSAWKEWLIFIRTNMLCKVHLANIWAKNSNYVENSDHHIKKLSE